MSTNARLIGASAMLVYVGTAFANPVQGAYRDIDNCDNHGNRAATEELGHMPPFDQDEWIETSAQQTALVACPGSDGTQANWLVTMTNLTDRYWSDLFYVADWTETVFSNVDGDADDFAAPDHWYRAFRIDSVGLNRPLVFESLTPDDVFEPGETWQFIVDDYSNIFGLAPDAFNSLGFAGASFGDPVSSASIVQFLVPSPGVLGVLGLGGLGAIRRRR